MARRDGYFVRRRVVHEEFVAQCEECEWSTAYPVEDMADSSAQSHVRKHHQQTEVASA